MKRPVLLLAFLCTSLSACGDDEGGGSATASASETNADGSSGGAATISVSGRINGFISDADVVGAEVCVISEPNLPCVMTDAMGEYVLPDVPAETQGILTASAADYIPGAVLGITASEDQITNVTLLEEPSSILFADAIGTTFDATKAHIAINVGTAGASFAINPNSGVGPAYVDDTMLPTLDSDVTFENGVGGWANVEPGAVDLTIDVGGMPCLINEGAVPGTAENSAGLDLQAGHFNSPAGGFSCP